MDIEIDRVALVQARGVTLDGSARFEWAWETVARIVANGGRFQS